MASAQSVVVRSPRVEDEREFLACVRRSRAIHRPWVEPPDTPDAFRTYVARSTEATNLGFLVCLRSTGEIAGVVNLNEIVRGRLESAYLAYYVFAPHSGKGHMTEGLRLVMARAFGTLGLHRLEANIQPDNRPSIELVRRLGFRKEGFSPRYLKIGGRWRDHERWAILAEEWK